MSTQSDTLVLNPQLMKELRQDYDYNQDLGHKDNPEYESQPVELNPDINLSGLSTTFKVFSVVFISIILIAAIGYVMYKRYAIVEEKKHIELTDEDTIYGIDFQKQIESMEHKKDYFQCIRLAYLQLLRHLHDNRKIFWQPSKTPTQYVLEMCNDDFRTLTNIFIRVRYGNYPADAALYDEVRMLTEKIEDGKIETREGGDR